MAITQTAPKKGLINFDFLQKLGKVLMTVIAVMPAAGLMISLGKLVQMGWPLRSSTSSPATSSALPAPCWQTPTP